LHELLPVKMPTVSAMQIVADEEINNACGFIVGVRLAKKQSIAEGLRSNLARPFDGVVRKTTA
jgi:hypothetical protein